MTSSHRQIENLIYRYASCMDDGDPAGLAAMFEHGRLVRPGKAPDAVGPEEVRKVYNPHYYSDGTPRTMHMTSNVLIEVDDADQFATARSYFSVLQQTDALPLQPIVAGSYDDTFHRVAGTWFFASRQINVCLVGDVTHHAKDPSRIHRAGTGPRPA